MTAPTPVPYPELWAKTATGAETGTTYGYPLYNHLDDTASVVEAVVERWVGAKNSAAYTKLSEHLGIPPEKALTFACLAHDIGKADPHFQAKVEELACSNPWYTTPVGVGAPHNIVSAQTVQEFLSRHGATRPAKRGWATVLAGHHGVLVGTTERPKKMNDHEMWLQVRIDLLETLCSAHGISEADLEALGRIEWRTGTVTLLTSLLITCDWLASNETAFPIPAMPGIETGKARAEKAMGENLALGPVWAPEPNPEGWQKRFHLPPGTELHDAQRDVLSAAQRMSDEGGLLLIESATGSGKSAAALLAADIVAAKTGATGIIYAQPSQATANSALPTVASWVAKHPSGAPVGASLAHGKARFVQDVSDIHRLSDGAITTHWWTTGRLAPFAPVTVSTIDQVLQSVLKARYAVLRQAALVGKVVVLDEVHSSDSHMSVYLERFLEYAGYWGTTVIAMSATLSDARRRSLVTAYESGMTRRAPRREDPEPDRPRGTSLPTAAAHSRVTVLDSSGLRDTGRLEENGTEIAVSFGAVAAEDIAKEVSQQVIQRPSCVGVVLNTVSRAQDVFEAVSAGVPGGTEVVLLHSRFTVTDRREIEQRVVEALGRNGSRPESLVVVATQVVEQALDLDFDVLYTDIAPADMLVQRLGRLHRHDRTRPAGRERAEAVVTGVDFEMSPRPEFAPGIDTVYDPATLYQTLACLVDKQRISRPQDVPGLVHAVFDACPQFPASWGDMSDVLEARGEAEVAARTHAEKAVLPAPYDTGWWKSIETILGDADYAPGVRAGSYTTEVCLLHRGGEEVVPVSAGDADPKSETAIAASTVPVPNYVIEDNYNDLVSARPAWWPKRGSTRWLAPVVLDGGEAEIGQWVLRYDSRVGVRVGKRDGE